MLRTIWVCTIGSLGFLLTFVTIIVVLPFSNKKKAVSVISRTWAGLIKEISGIDLTIEGKENILKDRSQIFMVNHLSIFDILVLLNLDVPFSWVAKKELFFYPFLGLTLWMIKAVKVDRANPQKAMKSTLTIGKRIREGYSLIVFPEGSRSRDGKLQDFKEGAFLLAIRYHIPIVPITIQGTDKVMPVGKMKISSAPVKITIHKPVFTDVFRLKDVRKLTSEVKHIISLALTA